MFKSIRLILNVSLVLAIIILLVLAIHFLKKLGVKFPRHPVKAFKNWLKEAKDHEA